ncbi:MAG: polysaccharide biosynthesis protein, partial [Robiginitomaculum sp.]|nr:polysaccharide biosynthesis protein [Robiginitomaculum sp.]
MSKLRAGQNPMDKTAHKLVSRKLDPRKLASRRLAPWITKLLVTLYDVLLGAACMYGVMRLRFLYEGKLAPENIDIKTTAVFAASCLVVWLATRANRAVWRFMSLDDVRTLLSAVIWSSVITLIILFLFFNRAEHLPRSVPFIAGGFFFFMLVASRALVMVYQNGDIKALFRRGQRGKPPAILIGRSQTLHNYMRDEALKKRDASHHIRGLIETEGGHKGRSIRGVPVIGNLSDIPGVVSNIEQLHGAKPILILVEKHTDRKRAARLVKLASALGTRLERLGNNRDDGLTPFEAADLIGRHAKTLDMAPVERLLKGKTVMITGAGGTIGSELVRQIAGHEPKHIVLVDASEMNLYNIDQTLSLSGDASFRPYLGDVRDEAHMREIFSDEKPDIILHAAALKHVPLMEANPIATVLTNVGGTKVIIDLAIEFGAESFTLISTDKAVSPNNIMGASKRIAEMMTLASAMNDANISSSAVRFGNVLASNGSVIPLFEKQIENGGPVTVTDKLVTRYFMTKEEAAALVLQAAALNGGQRKEVSAIYVLDMGETVNITHLAKQLIRLRGLVPGEDIEIKYTGLRPGEKME